MSRRKTPKIDKPLEAKFKRFMLVSHPGETVIEHFNTEIALCDAYANTVSNGISAEAYEVIELKLQLSARRRVP